MKILHARWHNPSDLLLPVKVRRLADPSLPTNLSNRCSFFALLDDERILRVREVGCFNRHPLLSQPRAT